MENTAFVKGNFAIVQDGPLFDVRYKGYIIAALSSFVAAKAYISRHTESDLKALDHAIKKVRATPGSNNNQNTKTL